MTDEKTLLAINVYPDERENIHKMAKIRGFKNTSDYLRHLILQDVQTHQVLIKEHKLSIEFDVDRGGYRGNKAE